MKRPAITDIRDRALLRLPLMLVCLGIISIGLIAATDHLSRRMIQTYMYTDNVHEAEVELSKAHLALEENMRGMQTHDIAAVWQGIDLAEEMLLAAINGGKTSHGRVITPLPDNSLRKDMEYLRSLIVRFRELARNAANKGMTSSDIVSMDNVYHEFLEKAYVLDDQLDELQANEEKYSKKLTLLILFSWTGIISAAVIGLWYRETQGRRMQAEIMNAKHQWEHTFDVIPDLIAVIDQDHNIIRCNRAMAEKMSLEPKDILGRKCYELFHKTSGPIESCPHVRLLHDNEPHVSEIYEKELDAHFLVSVSPLFDDDGVLAGSVHVARDITVQKKNTEEIQGYRNRLEELVARRTGELSTTNEMLRLEVLGHEQTTEALKLSEGRFKKLSQEFNMLLDAIPDSLLLISPDLKVTWANKSAFQTLIPEEAQLSEHCYSLLYMKDKPCDDCIVLKSFRTGNPETGQKITPAGRLLAVCTFPIRNEQGEVENVMELNTDITEKATMHAEQMRINQLASIGELAAGVAHEINNPINGIINYAQIIANNAGPESRGYDIAQRIIKEGERIAFIVTSLLSFARQRKEDTIPVPVGEILSDSLVLTETLMRKNGIDITIKLDTNLPLIKVHPQQIQQVFLNIINNARYALNQKYPQPNPDKIFLITARKINIHGEPFVQIVFEDHGTGIPGNVIDKMMNPFYTTKPAGQGTGLGLSISHGIIADHNGRLSVESREGACTRVIVSLPACRDAA